MNQRSDLRSYFSAVIETPLNIIFALLDVAAIIGVFLWVVDDISEAIVLLLFVLVTHIGHYLIFRRERSVNSSLRLELDVLKLSTPQLNLIFLYDGTVIDRLMISANSIPDEPNYDSLVFSERQKLQSVYEVAVNKHKSGSSRQLTELISLFVNRLKDRDSFEDEVEEYLEQFRSFLRKKYDFEKRCMEIHSTDFELSNSGTIPAHDVIVIINFPDQFEFLTEDEIMELEFYPDKPEPPIEPSPIFEPLKIIDSFPGVHNLSVSMPPISPGITSPPNVRGPFIKPGNSTEVSYEIDKLLHGFASELEEVRFKVDVKHAGSIHKIAYEIHSSDLARPLKGSLMIEIQ